MAVCLMAVSASVSAKLVSFSRIGGAMARSIRESMTGAAKSGGSGIPA